MNDLTAIKFFTETLLVNGSEADNALYRPLMIAVNYCDDLWEELATARKVVEAARRHSTLWTLSRGQLSSHDVLSLDPAYRPAGALGLDEAIEAYDAAIQGPGSPHSSPDSSPVPDPAEE